MLGWIDGSAGMDSVLGSAPVAKNKDRSIQFSVLSITLHHLYDSAIGSRC